jgi:hypothetical protein
MKDPPRLREAFSNDPRRLNPPPCGLNANLLQHHEYWEIFHAVELPQVAGCARIPQLAHWKGAIMKTSKRLAIPALALTGLLAGADCGAIVGGDPDGKRHPFVGIIAYQVERDGPWYVPQGGNAVLVSPKVAVTAGHVVEGPLTRFVLGVEPYQWGVVFHPRPVDRNAPSDLFEFREVPARLVHVAESVAWHPDLFVTPEAPDIGVIIFKEPVKGLPKARIPRPGLFDALRKILTSRLGLVGFGATEFNCCPPPGGGNRYSGSAPVVDLMSEFVITGALNKKFDVLAAPGDSGGPALFNQNLLIGVFSDFAPGPDPDALPFSKFQRTDSASACEFLSEYLTLNCDPIGH